MQAWDWTSRLPRHVLCGCLLLMFVAAWATPCVAQAGLSRQEELRLLDARIQFIQWVVDRYNSGYYLLTQTGQATIPVSKDDLALAVAILVYLGQVPPGEVAGMMARLKADSDAAATALKEEIGLLRQERQQLASGQSAPPAPPTTPTLSATTGQRPARGFWQLKEGYPKITNTNNSTAIETLASDVSTSSISYRYTKKKYSGEVEHDCTLSASFPGIDKAVREANEEFTFTLQGSWARGKDNGLFDGKCPYLQRDGGVTVVRADPLPAGKRLDEAAQIWVGRFTDGKDFASDRRTITVRMPAGGGECLYAVSIDPNHKVIWAYRWVE